MTLVRFAKTCRVQLLMLASILAMGLFALVSGGDLRGETYDCANTSSNCPSCNGSSGVYCCSSIQGFLPGSCGRIGTGCTETGVWNCGTAILCLNDQPLAQPCGTRDICIP